MSSMSDRIKKKARARRMHRIKKLLTFMLIISIPIGIWHLVHQPYFAYGSIQIEGTNKLTVDEVLSLGEGKKPINLFTLDRERIEEALRHDVRFQQVSSEYVLPGILKLKLVERKPALYLQNAHKNYVMLDYQGLVMNVTNGIPSDNAPMLVGIACGDMYIGDTIEDTKLLGLLTFLRDVGTATVDQFAEIAITDKQQVRIQLRDGLYIILGDLAEVTSKTQIFCTVYNEIKNKQLGAKYIDFTYKKPYVKLDENLAPKLLQGVNQ